MLQYVLSETFGVIHKLVRAYLPCYTACAVYETDARKVCCEGWASMLGNLSLCRECHINAAVDNPCDTVIDVSLVCKTGILHHSGLIRCSSR